MTWIQLGIPTANIPAEDLSEKHPDLATGVYYGVVALDPKKFAQENGSTADGDTPAGTTLFPAVLSIGYNPFYKNTVRSVVRTGHHPEHRLGRVISDIQSLFPPQEIHIMPPLTQPSPTAVAQPTFNRLPDFYGTQLNLLILGYIRPEYDYVSMEALIEDIRIDCEVARQSLLRKAYQRYLVDDGTASATVHEYRKWLESF